MLYTVQKIDQGMPGNAGLGRKTKVSASSMRLAAEDWCTKHMKHVDEEVLVRVLDAKGTREEFFRVQKVIYVRSRIVEST